jgi:WD40 repeat protein
LSPKRFAFFSLCYTFGLSTNIGLTSFSFFEKLNICDAHRPGSRHDKFSVLIAGEGRSKMNSNSSSEGMFISPQHPVTYASVYDNTVLRTFSGHSSRVTNLSMSPVDDRFLSCSDDRTIRLWDIQQPGCIAMIPPIPNGISGATAPYACFDSTGLVFAVTTSLPGASGNVGPIFCFLCTLLFNYCFHSSH